jgi:hypothetical protein
MKQFFKSLLILLIGLGSQATYAQLSGTVTVPGTYPTLAAAITALNTSGVSAATTIEVSADETAPTGGYIINTFTGSSTTNTVTIKAIGVITLTSAVGTSTTVDGVIKLNGADNVTIDGFTIAESAANATATTQMEWGIAVLSQSATNSSQNVTIKNCTINLNGAAANTAEIGIYAAHHSTTATTALAPTSAAGTYAGLKIIGCTVDNAYTGISIGVSGSAANLDANITVGESGAGNTVTNFGGGAIQAYGIRLEFGTNANINYNTVDNTAITTHTLTLDGIYTTNGTTQALTVTNNIVKMSRGSSSSQMCGIRNIGYTGAVTWSNNEITGCLAGGSTGVVYLMYNTAAATSLTVNNNNIHDNVGLNTTGTVSMFYNTGAVPNITISGNLFVNNAKVTATTGTFYAIWNTGAPTSGTETITNNIVNGQGIAGYAAVNYGIYCSTSLTQNRVVSGNTVSGMITSSTMYCLYLLSSNNSTVTNNIVKNITQTSTGTTYAIYAGGNNVTRSGNKVSDILFTGGAATFYANYAAGTVSNSMTNDTIFNIVSTGTAGFTMYGFYCSGSSTLGTISNCFASDVTNIGTAYCLYLTGTNVNAFNNRIRRMISHTASTTQIFYGAYATNASGTFNIYGNTIDSIAHRASAGGGSNGIHIQSALLANVYKNKIYDMANTNGTNNRVNGINITAATTANVYNNLIYSLDGGPANEYSIVNGINAAGGTGTYNLYNNTINLSGTVQNGGASGILLFGTTAATVNAINNIIKMDMTLNNTTHFVAAVRRVNTTITYGALSNNNIYYVPDDPRAFYFIEGGATPGTNSYSPSATPAVGTSDPSFNTGCSLFKAYMSGKESASFYENIALTNHIPTGTTYAEGGGQTLALVTDDITGATRTSPPDIGAYEFSGTAIVGDVTPPTITYTNIPNSICTNSVPVSVTITDASGVKTNAGSKPRIWFKKTLEKDTLPSVNSSLEEGWKYVEATNSTSPFQFNIDLSLLNTPAVTSDVIRYFIVAQDNVGNVSANQVAFKAGYCAAAVGLDTAAFPAKTTPAIKSFTILSPPSTATTVSSKPTICGSGTVVLSLTGDATTGAEYQWQSSSTLAGTYTDIVGATSATYTPTITNPSDKNFQCVVKCGGVSLITSTPVNIGYFDPQVTSVTNATRCGTGTMDLTATPSVGADISWYANATGGTALTTGSTFTTPSIAATTTYYAEATEGGTTSITGRVTPTALGAAATLTNYGIQFTINEQITFNSIDLFSGTGTAVTVALYNAGGTTQLFTTGSVTTTAGVKNTIPLNWTLAPGTYRLAEIAMTGTFFRESGTGIVYPIPITTIGQINGYFTTLTGTPTTSTTVYYYFYNMNITTGCRSPRVPVVATVTAPPTITMPANLTICSNDPAQNLTVSSSNPSYLYEWGPSTGLNTTSGATVAALPATTTTYVVTATDNSGGQYNGCSIQGSVEVKVNEIPLASDTKSSRDSVCFSEIIDFSLVNSGNATGLTYQWQGSTNGTTYTDISGATSATYSGQVDINSNRFFRCQLFCKGNLAITSTPKEIIVNAPTITSTSPATRCGAGNVTLAVNTTGAVNTFWYAAPTGGVPIGTGNTFTTPLITATTDFYVSASSGGSTIIGGMLNGLPTGTSGAGTTNYGIVFDVLSAFTLKSVKIYPISATSAAGTVTVDVINSAGTIMHTKTFNVTGSPIGQLVATTIDLDFNLVPGTNYKIRPGSFTGITGLQFEPAASAPGGNYGYPMVLPGVLSINTSTLTAAPTNTANNALYYYFYNWVIGSGCESPRQAITATVTPADAVTASPDVTICSNGAGTPLTASSVNTNYAYTWGPATGLSSTTGASVTANPTANTQYIVTASDATSGCANIDTVNVKVNQVPLSIDVKSTLDTVCFSENVTLSLFNSQPNAPSGLDYQWQSSNNGTTFTDIAGAINATHSALVDASNDRFFRCNLTCLSTPGVISTSKEILINAPSIANFTSATRCGAGTVNLSATAGNPNETLNWYSAVTGGTSIGTGSTFTTPLITSTTDFYVGSSVGGGGLVTPTLPAYASSYTGNVRGMWFTAPMSFKIKSLKVPAQVTGTGTDQSFAVVKFTAGPPPTYATVTNSFTVLFIAQATPGLAALPCNIQINVGDVIGIFSQKGNVCAYGPTAPSINLGGFPVTLYRLGMQFPLNTTAPKDLWYEASSIGITEFTYSVGCESPRQAVTATVTPAPTYAITSDRSVCNNAALPLTVTTGLADFNNFTWSPVNDLYTDAAGTIPYTGTSASTVYYKSSTAGNVNILSSATNTTSQCSNVDDITITNLPVPALASSRPELCLSGTADLSISPTTGYTNASFEWLDSPNGTAFSTISGANSVTFTTPTITNTTYYKAKVFDSNNNLCAEPVFNLVVNNPSVASVAGATSCPSTTVNLGATAAGTGTIKWYDVPTGGTSLASGATYTTPVLAASKTYYVESIEGGGGVQNVGLPAMVGTTANTGVNIGIRFDATSSLTVESIDVYPSGTGAGTATFELRNSAGTVLATYVANLTGTATPFVRTTLPVNFVVPAGLDYRIVWSAKTGLLTGLGREATTGFTFPYTIPGVISLTASTTTGFYYYIYNWKVSTGCASPRVPVVATINSCPRVNAKVFLSHVNPSTGIMDDYIKTLANFPVSDPYATVGSFNGNYTHVNSGPTATVSPTVLATLGNNAIIDWVYVELRQGTPGATTVTATKAGLLQKDGDIVGMDGVSPLQFNAPAGNYYIAIRHRNHTGFRTDATLALSNTATTLNFTNNSVTLYGAYPLVAASATVSVMNAGDSNSDGSIDAFDTIVWEIQNGLFDDYTNNADYNMDGSVDAFDTILWELNNGKYQELD